MRLDDYELRESLYRSARITVGRYMHRDTQTWVVIKALPPGAQGVHQVGRLRYEHKILRDLADQGVEGAPRPMGMFEGAGTVGLVMSDMGGTSVSELAGGRPMDVAEVLRIGCGVASALTHVHRAGVVHKDINPSNIVFNRATDAVQIIDFELASRLAREVQTADSLRTLEGTLAYMSPEQTGRIHAAVDFRSDLYACGATLYELLTGKLPFEDDDPGRLVYAILTQTPRPVDERGAPVPRVLARMVERLLAKSAEDRYNGAAGFEHDLRECQRLLQPGGSVPWFEIGQQDFSDRFVIPQRMYGREAEQAVLQQAYAQAATGRRQLVMVNAPSGMGKSALIQTLQTTLLQHGGQFTFGKHEQLRRHKPFSALAQAVAHIVHVLLQEPQEVLNVWQRRIQEALGNVGQAVVDIIPELRFIVGEQRPVPALELQETENRLLFLLQRLLLALGAERPLALFLDDLQWADAGTLKLIHALLNGEEPCAGLLILGACRTEDETNREALAKLHAAAATVIGVGPLPLAPVSQLLCDATRAPAAEVTELAEIVRDRTGGNPFFVQEFVKSLAEHGLFTYDPRAGRWRWDMQAIRASSVTDNVADLVAQELAHMAPEPRQLLSVAACLGTVFTLDALCEAQELTREQAAQLLQPALERGTLVPLSNAYRYASDVSMNASYRFAHDRVQNAAYEALDAPTRTKLHWLIGTRLLHKADRDHPERWVLSVVDHLNKGKALITDADQRIQLAKLNLEAAEQARLAAAKALTAEYLQTGLSCLPDNPWEAHAELTRALWLRMAEAELQLDDAASAEARLATLLQHTTVPEQRAEVHHKRMWMLYSAGHFKAAQTAGVQALRELGVSAPEKVRVPHLLMAAADLQLALVGTNVPRLAEVPCTASPRHMMLANAWLALSAPAFSINPNLFAYCSLRFHALQARYGIPSSFGGLVIINGALGNYRAAKDWGSLVYHNMRRNPVEPRLEVAHLLLALFLEVLEKPPVTLAERFTEIVQMCLEGGSSSHPGAISSVLAMLSCVSLDACIEAGTRGPLMRLFITEDEKINLRFVVQACYAMQGKTRSPTSFSDAEFDEEATLARDVVGRSTVGTVRVYKMQAMWLHRDFEGTLAQGRLAEAAQLLTTNAPSLILWFHLFLGLAITQKSWATGQRPPWRERRILRRSIKQLGRAAAAGPIFAGTEVLLQAEVAGLRGQHDQALRLYEQAHALLENSGHQQFVAAGWECSGRYLLAQGAPSLALPQLERAAVAYRVWGATRKVADLEREVAALRPQQREVRRGSRSSRHSTTEILGVAQVDFPALMKAAQAISGEVALDRLVATLLQTTQQLAGATRVALLLMRTGTLQPVADSAAESTPGAGALPSEVIDYVRRTQQMVVLNDVEREERFRDAFANSKRRPKALLCVPMQNFGKLKGVLYLENNLTVGSFGSGSIDTLTFLAAQAASALDSAFLYANLEQEVAQRTAELRDSHARVVALEKQTLEARMAGGFAHEMRNALSSVAYPLESLSAEHGETPLLDRMQDSVHALEGVHLDNPGPVNHLREDVTQLCDAIAVAQEGVARALLITGQILEYAQVADILPGAHTVALAPLVDRIVNDFAASFQAQGVVFHNRVGADVALPMRQEHATTVLQKLISNARDAVSQASEGQTRSIEVAATTEQGRVIMQVRDTGVGMSAQVQQSIFQPFFTTKGVDGVGLSLGHCRKLMQVYGGDIDFVSQENAGSTFRVTLPVA